ncbi:MAG: hypothetical protein KAT43_06125 [Nanoarchaeota archaeon]|nr:hypothetical protein [Nanoarchaeota archaeon]
MLYIPTDATRNIEPRTYIDEINGFRKPKFHIANREKDITQLIRRVAYSKKPNFALVGEPGNGKTMTLDYMIDVITGKKKIPKKHKWYELFETIRGKVKGFQTRDYLFLPNLQDPYRPYVLDFQNREVDEAEKVAEAFGKEFARFADKLGHHEKIHPFFTISEFKRYVHDSVRLIYEKLYGKFNDIEEYVVDFEFNPKKDFQTFDLEYTFLDKPNWGAIRKGLGMPATRTVNKKKKGDDKKKPKGKKKEKKVVVTQAEVKKNLRRRLRRNIQKQAITLFTLIDEIEVPEHSVTQKKEITKKIIQEVQQEYKEASDIYKEKGIVPYFRKLSSMKVFADLELRIAPKSMAWCMSEFQAIAGIYKKKAPKTVGEWIDSVVRYFRDNQDTFAKALLNSYKSARGDRGASRETKRPDHPFAFEDYSYYSFELPHGKSMMEIEQILQIGSLALSKGGELCIKYPGSFSEDEMWGKISKPDDSTPPHMCFSPGYLMEASMLVLIDNMQGFFKALLGSEVKDSAARRQTILTFVESGDLLIERDGITFNVHSPTMIIGCDNDSPFIKHHSYCTDLYDVDSSMASRFILYDWENYAPNNKETRKGTIGVIHQAVREFNKEYSTKLKLAPEIIDKLLVSTISSSLLRLDYRFLNDRIFDLLSFLRRKNHTETFTLEHMIEFNREKEPNDRFATIDARFDSRVCDPPKEAVGQVSGVTLFREEVRGDFFPIRSGVIHDLARDADGNFQHCDSESGLNTQVTHKGYLEAADFVKRLIGKPTRFVTKTIFHRVYDKIDGPSGSLAIALSLCSAIGNVPILRNKAVTGTLDFSEGTIGPIGGVYDKAVAIWRAQQHMKEAGSKERMQFMFPIENLRELREELEVSPYPVADDIDLIPVSTFDQAFHLATTNSKIDMKTLKKNAEKTGKALVTKMRVNTTKWNKKVIAGWKKG